jgi:integrase
MVLERARPLAVPTEGWVFPNGRGRPASLREMARRRIRPTLEKAGLRWKGLYAGRRGSGTILVDLTGNIVSAQELLRHKSMTTTALHYNEEDRERSRQRDEAAGGAGG